MNTALIPREALFGSPEKDQARISPDGKRLAYRAPFEGKMSVWVRTLGEDDARLVAHDPARPIPWLAWQGDSLNVLYLQDAGGNENYHLFQVGLDGSAPVELTPGENVRCMPLAVDHRFPGEALVQINQRNPALFDVARIDLRSGAVTIEVENPGNIVSWLADNTHVVRAALAQDADGSMIIRVRDAAAAPWRDLDRIPSEDFVPRLVAFSPDNQSLYAITAKGANAARLVCYDVASGAYDVRLEDAEYDVSGTYVDPASDKIVAASILRDRLHWKALDDGFADAFAALKRLHDAELAVLDTTADGNTLVVRYTFDTAPGRYYLYDRKAGEATFLFEDRPSLSGYTLAPMQPVRFEARDGLPLRGYLTLPVGVEPKNLPTVLYVHGGPWHRDRWGYEDMVQWMANRGYAVLQVNFRGSTGYGKAFLNAANRQWAGAMRTDLLDARDWAIAEGIADPSRFAIMGGSYGGYAVLVALAFTPDAFTCGVDIVGPSNLNTLLASVPPYWKPLLKIFHERMGEDAEFLSSQSPLFKAGEIRVPLLVAQGANDPRVKRQESDQIVEAMRANGIPVTYAVFPDEGHGFANPRNSKRFTALTEAFLARYLGGRTEPQHPDEDYEPFLA
ncbi:MAG TPA: S9 family peptidase [Candidatus Limnocylindrales bacterium]|nr:S9 family peptidase [Candidatus Limnocylindrales bacterium]